MKATKIFTAVITAMLTLSTVQAAEIPRESAPLNATEEQIVIVENLICDILDEVAAGKLGYTEAAGAANTRVRKAVVAGEQMVMAMGYYHLLHRMQYLICGIRT